MKDFYKILGVTENATEEQIKKAYRALAKKYHPDANPGNKQAENKFKEMNEAYEVLSNKEKRAKYEQMRKWGAGSFEGSGRGAGRQGAGDFDYGDASSIFGEFGGFGSFADIFSSIFGEAGQPRGHGFGAGNRSAAGDDLRSEIDVPFETAAHGGQISVNMNVTEMCSMCKGSGAAPGSTPQVCPECGGIGVVSFSQGNFAVSRPCPRCLGRGRTISQPCSQCKGKGKVIRPRQISVKIPAGIESGNTIRLKGLGNQGDGGPAGDLYLKINVTGHHFFWREGQDIHCRVPVSQSQAEQGAKVRVRTISSQKVDLKIPAGTKSGAKFKLKGFGISADGRKGDQIVEIQVRASGNSTAGQTKEKAQSSK